MPADGPYSVRRLQDGDRDRWLKLWAGYLSFYRAEISDHVTEVTFRRLRDGCDGMLGLVATAPDGEPVGIAHLVFHPSTWAINGYCYLEDLYVDRSARGGDVSRALFDAVFGEARARGSERVYWHTQQFNGAARSLYDTVGRLTSMVEYEVPL
jgi:GNAT superfamily N-acetyltransferase